MALMFFYIFYAADQIADSTFLVNDHDEAFH